MMKNLAPKYFFQWFISSSTLSDNFLIFFWVLYVYCVDNGEKTNIRVKNNRVSNQRSFALGPSKLTNPLESLFYIISRLFLRVMLHQDYFWPWQYLNNDNTLVMPFLYNFFFFLNISVVILWFHVFKDITSLQYSG